VLRDVVLSWTPGEYANAHDVYFGVSLDDVNNATATVDPAGVYKGRQDVTSYAVGETLDFGETYYWRVDEVNAAPDFTVFKGDVWSFTVEPFEIVIPGAGITVSASSANRADEGPENTVNGSGLDGDDLHSSENTAMWLSSIIDPNTAWIQYEFDGIYKMYQMSVWNYNSSVEPVVGFGIKEATIEYSIDGTDWSVLGTAHEFAQGPGAAGYAANTIVDLAGVAAKYVRIVANSNWGGIVNQFGLSEVRFSSVPVLAREPNPVPDAADVDVAATLSFRAGREAAEHHLYLGTDEQAVIDGNVPVVIMTEPDYAPPLDLASTYYWRVDEVNDAETPATWSSDIWSFSTQEYLVVEDFEGYSVDNPIWETWLDGLGFGAPGAPGFNPGNGTGAAVGDENTPSYMEETLVHGGDKSVPFGYNNAAAGVSEIARTLTPAQDWTVHGVQTLSLWFFGDVNNVPGQLYVKVNGARVDYDGEAGNLTRSAWRAWNIDLASIGVNLQSVTSLAVGIEGGSAAGKLLLDDIRLYAYPRELVTPVDPGTTGLQAHYEFEGTTNDSSVNARHGTIMGNPTFVAGQVGQAIDLDGVDDFVEVTGYKGILQPPWTLSCWVKTTTGGDMDIMSWGTEGGGLKVEFRLHDGRLRVEHGNGNNRGDAQIHDGEWHHAVAVLPEGGVMEDVTFYLDGKPLGVFQIGNGTNPFVTTEGIDFNIGRSGPMGARYFTGAIDDVYIYDRVLSDAEIAGSAGQTMPFDKPF